MRRLLLVLPCALFPLAARAQAAAPPTARAGVAADVAYLASDALEGRATGTRGNALAADFIARRFAALGLAPAFADPACAGAEGCERTYFQEFARPADRFWRASVPAGATARNVAALVRGADPALRREVVVVGAHYDHMGRGPFGVDDPERGPAVHNGADDNASGVAALLAAAERLAADPPRRSVLLVAFGAEELWMLGSWHFVREPPVPLASVVAMLNLDMVGRMRGSRLTVFGGGTAPGLRATVQGANAEPRLSLRFERGGLQRSDHAPFVVSGIPALHFFTGMHGDYHRASDDVERLNVDGIVRVAFFTERVARALADRYR